MNRNFCIGFLIVCFGFSSVNVGLAAEVIGAPPIVVQPYEVQELTQDVLNRDRMNRDEEIAIKELIEENDKLTQSTLAHQQDEGLSKIDQTMLNYRNSLISRDQQRIAANGPKWVSRYGDLVALTEDADAMTVDRGLLEEKSGMFAQKYKMLSDLKDEMTALNEKLKGQNDQEINAVSQKDTVTEGFKKVAQDQQDKIQMLVLKLGDMDQKIAKLEDIIAQKDQQIALLKSELEDKITLLQQQAKELSSKEENIKTQANQIENLPQQSKNSSTATDNTTTQADQIANLTQQLKDRNATIDVINNRVMDFKNQIKTQMQQQADDLKAKEKSIVWLNQVLAATKNKAEYYKLTSQINQVPMQQVQEEMQKIKDDFAKRSKNYDQLEGVIASLKNQVSQLGVQLSKAKNQSQQDAQVQQDLKTQLQDKLDQIAKMKTQIQVIQQDQAKKDIDIRKAADLDDRLKLAHQLIDLHQQEADLLQEKSVLTLQQFPLLDEHVSAYESRMKILLANHRIQDMDLRERLGELKDNLSQNQQEMDSLKQQLEEKITNQKNQEQLDIQIQDLKTQLQDKQDQIVRMKAQIQGNVQTQVDTATLKEQLAAQQDKMDLLKQELDNKIAESNKMTLMMGDYQRKLESKDNAYNEQLGQVLTFRNYQAQMEKKITDLNLRLKEKESQDRDLQAKDLSLSMMDEKIKEYQEKINGLQAANESQLQEITGLKDELAQSRQRLDGMPSSDEIDFLRSGLQKATSQLQQKEEMLSQIKANTDEYSKEFKSQTREFESLKQQLQKAREEIDSKNEDLKYKDMELTRFKIRSKTQEDDLQKQIVLLTQKLEASGKRIHGKTHENKVEALEDQLKSANLQIKDLQGRLNQFTSSSKTDPVQAKLKQALDKIDEQGRVINALAQKLQDAGQTADLSRN